MKLKFLIKSIFLLIGFSISINCSHKYQYDENIPEDFSFMIHGWCYYDSSTGRCLYKDTTVIVNLNENDMTIIYDAFKKSDFLSLPDIFECAKYGTSSLSLPMPDFYGKTIWFTYKGITKMVEDPIECSKKTKQKEYKRFKKVDDALYEIINNKDQVKKIKPDTSKKSFILIE